MPQSLNYQFLFLFDRQRTVGSRHIKEPEHLPINEDQVNKNTPPTEAVGYPDGNKRLFRLHIPAAKCHQDMQQLLLDSWRKVSAEYEKCRIADTVTLHTSLGNESETLLLSVAVLIIDDELKAADHTVTLPLYDVEKKEKTGDCHYEPDNKALFELTPADFSLKNPVTFIEFNPEFKPKAFTASFAEKDKWQLSFKVHDEPCLIALKAEEDSNYIAFSIYGLARHDITTEKNQELNAQLEEFLLFGKDNLGYSALMFLLNPIMTQHRQYNKIDTAAHKLDHHLRRVNAHYGNVSDAELYCKTREQLEHELHEMKSLISRASYELGRIPQAIETLHINRRILLERLHIVNKHGADVWRFDWQWEDEALTALQQQQFSDGKPTASARPLLLNQFDYGIENLRNQQQYIEGKLTHLRGSIERWELALEQQKLELYEKLGHLGHGIIFLVALAEMGHVLHGAAKGSHGAEVTDGGHHWYQPALDLLHWFDSSTLVHILASILQSPTLFLLLVLIILFPVGKAWWRFSYRRRLARKKYKALRHRPE
ncbi:hypothetical protein [Thioflexithrix psekupsensis]|uniref:Uncharacterized protein n=1 Tax=Thioflexithrix psekupsensis TaxID=1570016 RepID=A0A251XAV5_9GAMM|nr:hypothetical protein [Thioflexithrix psekupsensis]OUD15562.1 hypothetical protein TPSD3_03310 [Thioflexithrix psekupsensis]